MNTLELKTAMGPSPYKDVEPPPTILTEGMIVSYADTRYQKEHDRKIMKIASMHPSGVLLQAAAGTVESYTMEQFLKLGPFPVGKVVEKRHWWYGNQESWVYGQLLTKE
jgi:hypothetical protein